MGVSDEVVRMGVSDWISVSTSSSAAVKTNSIVLATVPASTVADSSRSTNKTASPASVPAAICANNARINTSEMSEVDVVAAMVVVNSRIASRLGDDVIVDAAMVVASSRSASTRSSISDNEMPAATIA